MSTPDISAAAAAADDDADTLWNLPLIGTKMTPPRLPRGWVRRAQPWLAAADATVQHNLVLLEAPAGCGKTTQLAQAADTLHAHGHVVAWVALDTQDDELRQFGAYVLTALRHASGGALYRAHELLRRDPLTPVKTVVSVLLNEVAACPRRVVLVLDDVDRLPGRAVADTLMRLVRYASDNFQLLLGVRSAPPLDLGHWRAQGKLLWLGEAALRFSAEEARLLVGAITGQDAPAADVDRLCQATEGWVTGLQLAALALRDSGSTAWALAGLTNARRDIDAYLNDAVLTQLPAPVLDFLLHSAVLERLCPPLCDAMLGCPVGHSAPMLDWLERHNIFVRSLQDSANPSGSDACAPPWYRYHALLVDALRRRLVREHGAALPGLHRRASLWLASQGLWPEAVRHALAAGDADQAADWVQERATLWVDRGDVRGLLAWMAQLPAALVQQRPRLRLARAWAEALALHTDAAERSLCPSTPADASAPADPEVLAVRALIAGLADDSPRSLDLGRQAQALTQEAPAWVHRFAQTAQLFGLMYEGGFATVWQLHQASRQAPPQSGEPIYASVYRQSMFGLAALLQGRLTHARSLFETALRQAEQAVGRDSAAAVLPAGYLASLYLEHHDLALAERMVSGREGLAFDGCALGSLLRFARAAAGLQARRGQLGAALALLEETREVAQSRQWLRLRAGLDAEAVRLLLRDGQLHPARELARALRTQLASRGLPEQRPGSALETWGWASLVQARLLLAEEQPEAAAALLDPMVQRLHAVGLDYQAHSLRLVQALALHQARQPAAAQALVAAPLVWAANEQALASWVDEGEPMRRLLRQARHTLSNSLPHGLRLCERVLAAFADDRLPNATTPTVSDPLSRREREILQHMARGLSNKEISRALRVAPETVKWHLKNIYDKLQVSSRVEAVQVGLWRQTA